LPGNAFPSVSSLPYANRTQPLPPSGKNETGNPAPCFCAPFLPPAGRAGHRDRKRS
jgi:hypothetical protein